MTVFGGNPVRWPLRLVLLFAFILVGNLSATVVLTCGFNGGPLSGSGCYSLPTFSFNETLDWQTAYGSADSGAHSTTYNPVTSGGPWLAAATDSGLTVGADFGPTYSGTNVISRLDNFALVNVEGNWVLPFTTGAYADWQNWAGTFDAAPDAGVGATGDHLLSTSGGMGALELQFSSGISGALFRISNGTTGDVDATVAAYSVLHPIATDVPIMTYTIHATSLDGTAPGGNCAGLSNSPTPIPCNTAPYIGISTGGLLNIRSLVISTPSATGVFLDTLYLDDGMATPEPGTMALTGVVGILAFLGRRRRLRDGQS